MKNSSQLMTIDLVSHVGNDQLEDDNVGAEKFDRTSHNGVLKAHRFSP
jgi:hypothetical protein